MHRSMSHLNFCRTIVRVPSHKIGRWPKKTQDLDVNRVDILKTLYVDIIQDFGAFIFAHTTFVDLDKPIGASLIFDF